MLEPNVSGTPQTIITNKHQMVNNVVAMFVSMLWDDFRLKLTVKITSWKLNIGHKIAN